MLRAICFGAADGGRRLFGTISEKYKVIAFTDNDKRKWGSYCNDIPIVSPKEAFEDDKRYDAVIITSAPGFSTIKKQLLELGIDESKIISSYIEAPLESRVEFLKRFSEILTALDEEGDVAEAGVFEGDFARFINEYFPYKKLHLFDTFEGFAQKDIEIDKKCNYSNALAGDYSNTSEDSVIARMNYPNNVIIHKGYFPDTAKNVHSKFCFVNLDLDLYEPTYRGLYFFRDKLTSNGIILVHDYFADNFKGPKEAVNRFVAESEGKARILPIGDGISVMVIIK